MVSFSECALRILQNKLARIVFVLFFAVTIIYNLTTISRILFGTEDVINKQKWINILGERRVVHAHADLSISRFNTHSLSLDFLDRTRNPCFLEQRINLTPEEETARYSRNEYYKEELFQQYFNKLQNILIPLQPKSRDPTDFCRLRCFPYFALFGVAESETRRLYSIIVKHPEVLRPLIGETRYWDKFRFQGACLNDYMDLYDNVTAHLYKDIVEYKPTNQISGEYGSMYTLTDPVWFMDPRNEGGTTKEPKFVLARDLHSLLPNMKLILLLREPVKHIYWHYNNAPYGQTDKSPEEFHERIERSLTWWKECTLDKKQSERQCASGNLANMEIFENRSDNPWWPKSRFGGTLRDGLYVLFIQDLLKHFPKNNLLIIRSEDLKSMKNVFSFLGVDTTTLDKLEISSSDLKLLETSSPPAKDMRKETREKLRQFYAPFNSQLAELLNDERFTWQET